MHVFDSSDPSLESQLAIYGISIVPAQKEALVITSANLVGIQLSTKLVSARTMIQSYACTKFPAITSVYLVNPSGCCDVEVPDQSFLGFEPTAPAIPIDT